MERVWRSGSFLELSVAVWLIPCRGGQQGTLRSDNVLRIPPPAAIELLPVTNRIAQLPVAIAVVDIAVVDVVNVVVVSGGVVFLHLLAVLSQLRLLLRLVLSEVRLGVVRMWKSKPSLMLMLVASCIYAFAPHVLAGTNGSPL